MADGQNIDEGQEPEVDEQDTDQPEPQEETPEFEGEFDAARARRTIDKLRGEVKQLKQKGAPQDEALALENRQLKVALMLGIPATVAARLRGDDEAALIADAEALLDELGIGKEPKAPERREPRVRLQGGSDPNQEPSLTAEQIVERAIGIQHSADRRTTTTRLRSAMADKHIFIKGEKYAKTALALLRKRVGTPALFVNRFGITDFKGAKGDTVNVKRPPVLVAREKEWRGDDAIVVDRLVQTSIPVVLNKHPYSAVALTSEEETLDEVDYVRDVQAPQVDALLHYFEGAVIGALKGATYKLTVGFENGSDPRKVAIQARKLFQDNHVPAGGRYWLVGSSVSAAIAGHEKLLDVNTAGIPEALREGVVGRLAGFTIIEVDHLGEDESYFVHNSAVAIATVAPVVPQGASKGGAVAAGHGLAVTQVWDYDGKHVHDRSVVHAFVGASLITDPQLKADGSIKLNASNEPTLEFVRGIKVNFTQPAGSP